MVLLEYEMTKVIKTAISLPEETFRKAEASRRKAGQSRSELYAKALEAYLRAQELRLADEQLAEAYRKHPETPAEVAEVRAFAKLSAKALEKEDW